MLSIERGAPREAGPRRSGGSRRRCLPYGRSMRLPNLPSDAEAHSRGSYKNWAGGISRASHATPLSRGTTETRETVRVADIPRQDTCRRSRETSSAPARADESLVPSFVGAPWRATSTWNQDFQPSYSPASSGTQ
jgi:hypothetical protein